MPAPRQLPVQPEPAVGGGGVRRGGRARGGGKGRRVRLGAGARRPFLSAPESASLAPPFCRRVRGGRPGRKDTGPSHRCPGRWAAGSLGRDGTGRPSSPGPQHPPPPSSHPHPAWPTGPGLGATATGTHGPPPAPGETRSFLTARLPVGSGGSVSEGDRARRAAPAAAPLPPGDPLAPPGRRERTPGINDARADLQHVAKILSLPFICAFVTVAADRGARGGINNGERTPCHGAGHVPIHHRAPGKETGP